MLEKFPKSVPNAINWFTNFNLIQCFLVLTWDSRDFPFIFLSYHFILPSKLLFPLYPHLILFWRQRFTRTAVLHRAQSHSIQKWAHIPNLCKGSTHSVYQLAPYPALNAITFLGRSCSVKDFTEGPRLIYQIISDLVLYNFIKSANSFVFIDTKTKNSTGFTPLKLFDLIEILLNPPWLQPTYLIMFRTSQTLAVFQE